MHLGTRGRWIRSSIALTVFASVAFVASAGPAHAAPACGSTIVTPTILDADVTCDDTFNPALIVDSTSLDLNGFTVSGENGINSCIQVIGAGSVVENGTVTSCEEAVVLDGTGGHVARNLKTTNGTDDGVVAVSDDNVIHHVVSSLNATDGFKVLGSDNHLFSNTASDNDDDGFDIDDSTTLWSNRSTGNGLAGFFTNGATGGNVLVRNVASKNDAEGFDFLSPNNHLLLNTASKNGAQGFYLDAADNLLGGNKATKNTIGFDLDFGSGNRFYGNAAADNSDLDLRDGVNACDDNDWEDNKGKKANEPCTRGRTTNPPQPVTPTCGDTLSGGNFYLKKSVGPCTGSYGLQLVDASLDMRGNSIKGDGSIATCVLMDSLPSILQNGSVSGCEDGVVIPDTSGGHLVRKVKAKNINDDAFEIQGDDNVLHHASATGSGGHAFHYGGDGNYLFKNKARDDAGAAFDDHGLGNTTWSSRSTKSLRGFVVDDDATGSGLFGNRASLANEQGFDIRGDLSIVLANSATDNKTIGFEVSSDLGAGSNLIGGNKAIENDVGVSLRNALSNAAVGNAAKRNKLDLEDLVDACVTNLWEGNRFKTDDPDCIE